VPFPVIVLSAAAIGFLGGKFWPAKFFVIKPLTAANEMALHEQVTQPPTFARGIKVLIACISLWVAPVLLLGLWRGWEDVFVQEGIFFSKAALVTFGGAYAVLPYVAQAAVTHFHWLQPGQMLDGLGLAETTPGPLIMVVQFVGFMGGWTHPGHLSPLLAGTIGALITTWTTFVPCFLWILLGAPYIELMRGQVIFTSALSAVTAAVVGVILNLAVWFGLQTLFPASGVINWFAVVVGLIVFFGLWRGKWGIVPVVLGSGLLGVIWHLAGGSLGN
jgi:chromate transporter